jgi:rsbT antagonist protein RsbS
MRVPVLKQGACLVAVFQPGLTDAELLALREDLSVRVGEHRARGVVLDVTALDLIDSFGARTLRGIALALRLRGAETVLVGIQPDVAFAMAQLGLTLEGVDTALDLEEGTALLSRRLAARRHNGH